MVGQIGKNCKSLLWIESTGLVLLAAISSLLTLTSCQDGGTALTAEVPLHLEDHLDTAKIVGSEVPADVPEAIEWRFDEPQPDWKPIVRRRFGPSSRPPRPDIEPAQVKRTKDSLRHPDPGQQGMGTLAALWRHLYRVAGLAARGVG